MTPMHNVIVLKKLVVLCVLINKIMFGKIIEKKEKDKYKLG